MKRRGFTLVEMLAVIAILGILVIIVLPNVLKSYRDAKKIAFIDEAKTLYTKATDAYVLGRTQGKKIGLITESNEYKLDLENASNLVYYIRIDNEGQVLQFRMQNSEFCIVGVGDFLNNFEKENVIELSKADEAVNCETSSLVDHGTYVLKLQASTPKEREFDPRTIFLKYNIGWFKDKAGRNHLDKDESGNDKVTIPYRRNAYYKGAWVTRIESTGTIKVKAINCDGTLAVGADGGGTFTGSETTDHVDAIAEFEPKYYQVKYELNGGSGSITNLKVPYNTEKKLDKNKDANGYGLHIKKTGYFFKGWESDNVPYEDEATLPVVTDDNENEKSHFKYDNDAVCSSGADPANTNVVAFIPVWEAIKYNIAYDFNNGSGNGTYPEEVTYDSLVTIPNPKRTGYTYTGWTITGYDSSTAKMGTVADVNSLTTDISGTPTNLYYKNLTPLNGNTINFKANWNAKVFTVKYDGNGATSGSTSQHNCTYDQECLLAANGFLRTGYKFDGWKLSNTGDLKAPGDNVKNVSTGEEVIYYAQWTACGPGTYLVNNVCTSCSAGTYSTGAANAACTKCAAGTYSTAVGASAASTCKKCGAGTYQPNTGSTTCIKCAAGTYQANTGQTSCTKCAAGTYSTAEGATAASTCTKCAKGTYSTTEGATAATTCKKCAKGTYQANTGQTSCTSCPAGTYSTTEGATAATTCKKCAKGTYQANTGSTSCTKCAAGTYSTAEGATASTTCKKCAKGTYQNLTGQTSCTKCGKGTYSSAEGATSITTCIKCGKGTYSAAEGATSDATCTKCAAGTYNNSTGQSSCTKCAAGTYQGNTGQTSCSNCDAGTTSTEGSLSCSACPNNANVNTWSSGCTINTCNSGYTNSGNACVHKNYTVTTVECVQHYTSYGASGCKSYLGNHSSCYCPYYNAKLAPTAYLCYYYSAKTEETVYHNQSSCTPKIEFSSCDYYNQNIGKENVYCEEE